MATAVQVARHLEQHGLSGETQLQKLVYYCQAWALTWTGRPLFDEDIQAWEGGPVTPSVWRARKAGQDLATPPLDDDEAAIVDAVHAFYGRIGGRRLSDLTHAEAPWKDTWADGCGKNRVIEHSAIRREYTEKALLDPQAVPRAPTLAVEVDSADVLAAGDDERRRWRSLLDRLAQQ